MNYSTKEFLAAVDDSSMPISTKLIRESLLQGTYPGKNFMFEAAAEILSIDLVQEPYGKGVSVKLKDGHEYRYAADDTHDKYHTPELVATAAKNMLKHQSSGAVLGWLSRNAILYAGSKTGNNSSFPRPGH